MPSEARLEHSSLEFVRTDDRFGPKKIGPKRPGVSRFGPKTVSAQLLTVSAQVVSAQKFLGRNDQMTVSAQKKVGPKRSDLGRNDLGRNGLGPKRPGTVAKHGIETMNSFLSIVWKADSSRATQSFVYG